MESGGTEWAAVARAHEGLVAEVVHSLGIYGEASKDATQEGLISLRKIARRFEPGRGNQFSTFCRKVLVRHLIKHRKGTNAIRVPPSTLDKVKATMNASAKYRATPETVQAVARTMAISYVSIGPAPGDVSLGHDPESSWESHEAEVERRDEAEHLRRVVLRIPARARQALIRTRGLFGNEPESLADVARDLEIPVDVARSLVESAMEELRILMDDAP